MPLLLEVKFSEIKQAVSQGDVEELKKLFTSLQETCDYDKNSCKFPNIIITACKFDRLDCIKYLLSNDCVNIVCIFNGGFFEPDDEDEYCHNVLYYCIRNGNVKLIDFLIDSWPSNYFKSDVETFDRLMSLAYQELALKNVDISDAMSKYVCSKLFSVRFNCEILSQQHYTHDFIKGRISFLIEIIKDLLDITEVNEKYYYIASAIAKNMCVLKKILKCTYDKLPWEEIEFCIISFISTWRIKREVNLFYNITLSVERIQYHLKNFLDELKNLNDNIININFESASFFPKQSKEEIMCKITSEFPQFRELYSDHRFIRDVHSLSSIQDWVDVASSVDPSSSEGQLVVFKVLHVISDYLKDTLDSPKLSKSISNLILLSLPLQTRIAVSDLKNASSNSYIFMKRMEMVNNSDLLMSIHADLLEINKLTSEILNKKKIELVRFILKQISQISDMKAFSRVSKLIESACLQSKVGLFQISEQTRVYNLIVELENLIRIDTNNKEKKSFMKIKELIRSHAVIGRNVDCSEDIVDLLSKLPEVKKIEDLIAFKKGTNSFLSKIDCDWSSYQFQDIRVLLFNLFTSTIPHFEKEKKRSQVLKLFCHIFSYIPVNSYERESLNELVGQIIPTESSELSHSNLASKNKKYNKYVNSLCDSATRALEAALTSEGIKIDLVNPLTVSLKLKGIICINVLLLDLLTCLELQKSLGNNLLSLDDSPLLLFGSVLQDHLLCCSNVVNLLKGIYSDSVQDVAVLNAVHYIKGIKNNPKKDMPLCYNLLKVKNVYDKGMNAINSKKLLFASFESGDLEGVKVAVKQGADLSSRDHLYNTCFHFAAKASDVNATKYLLEQNLDVNVSNILGQTPLHIAAEWGRDNILELLLKNRFIVNEVDLHLRTALHFAAIKGHDKAISVLLEHGVDFSIKDSYGKSPLHYAVEFNHKESVVLILQKAGDVNEILFSENFSALHLASEQGHHELVEYLFSRGANVNAKSKESKVPLFLAAMNGHLKAAEILISHGANVNSKASDGLTPLHKACEEGSYEVTKLLLLNGADVYSIDNMEETPIHLACAHGHHFIVSLLLEHGAEPNFKSLLMAVKGNHKNVVELIIGRNIDVNGKCENKNSLLHIAVLHASADIVNSLVTNNALVNARNCLKITPLHLAAELGKCDIMEILIMHGAGINSKDVDDATPLHAAAKTDQKDAISLLIKSNAKLEVFNLYGLSPLHVACSNGAKLSASIILQSFDCPNLQYRGGMSPLHVASFFGQVEIVDFLIKHKAEVNIFDRDGVSPLQMSVAGGHREIVELLIANGACIKCKNTSERILYDAIKSNRKDILGVLISGGFDVVTEGFSFLEMAIICGYKGIVEILLMNKVKVTGDEDNKTSPLHLAAIKGKRDIAELLLTYGADINAVDEVGCTPLHLASSFNHPEVVRLLISKGANINIRDYLQLTPFDFAFSKEYLSILNIILECDGVDLNFKSRNGWTPLHIVASKGNVAVLTQLINAGANYNTKNVSDSLPIHIAAREGHKEVVEYLLNLGQSVEEPGVYKQTMLHYAAMKGKVSMIKFLVGERKANINARDKKGLSALHVAAKFGHKNAVECLINVGCIFNSVNNKGLKPMDVTECMETKRVFLATAKLFKAVKLNNLSDVEESIKNGAVINAVDSDAGSVIHYAAWKGNIDILNVLFKHKCNPNVIGKSRFTPLHYAVKFSHYKVVLSLLINGAIYNIESDNCKIPVHLGTEKPIISLLKLINEFFKKVGRGYGKINDDLNEIKDSNKIKAITNCRNENGKTLVQYAIETKHAVIASQLLKVIKQIK